MTPISLNDLPGNHTPTPTAPPKDTPRQLRQDLDQAMADIRFLAHILNPVGPPPSAAELERLHQLTHPDA